MINNETERTIKLYCSHCKKEHKLKKQRAGFFEYAICEIYNDRIAWRSLCQCFQK